MASATPPYSVIRHSVLCLASAGLLLGCVEGSGTTSGSGAQNAAAASVRGGSNREVEAPDVFQTTDSALWDGRPSLGGIWVASPDVTDPMRVVILNPATGKSVNGALFRRERENPGPPLQVSSDTAEALGLLAGQPTMLQVTALRKSTEAAPAAAEPAPAVAAAAPSEPAPEAAATAEGGTVEAAATEAAKPKTWKERRAEAKAKREAEKAAKAAAATAESGTVAVGAAAATADNAAVAAVETAPLDARSPEVAAAADAAGAPQASPTPEPEKKKTRREIRAEQKAVEAAAADATTAATTTATTTGTGSRAIQIASFSKEENANRAVEALAKINVNAQMRKSEQGGKAIWGVVATGDEALLATIKDAGFADAFFLN